MELKELELLEKGLLDPKEIDRVTEGLDDSLLQIIALKGGTWCSVVVFGNKNNKGSFTDFKSGKYNQWAVQRKIEVYKKLWKALKA